jgi:hypothetical protein
MALDVKTGKWRLGAPGIGEDAEWIEFEPVAGVDYCKCIVFDPGPTSKNSRVAGIDYCPCVVLAPDTDEVPGTDYCPTEFDDDFPTS